MSDKLHVLVISSNIKNPDTLAAAAKDDVLVIRYDADHTRVDDLAKMIHNALGGKKADSIAFATHSANAASPEIRLTANDITSIESLATDYLQQKFWMSVGSDLSDKGRIDLLACSITSDQAGINLVLEIELFSGKHVAASADLTGSASLGGNWVLETGNVDLKKVYFDDHKIDNYDGVLAPINHFYNGNDSAGGFNILDNQSITKGGTVYFVFDGSTFHDLSGDTITYTAEGMPNGLVFNSDYRLFNGTPKAVLGKTLLPEYTITVYASDASGGTDSLSFTLKIANAKSGESGQHVPTFASNPGCLFYATEGKSVGTLLTPNYGYTSPYCPLAVDSDVGTYGIIGYRFVAPVQSPITDYFAIASDGKISMATATAPPGLYKLTVEAFDGTGYQNTSHCTISIVAAPCPPAWLNFGQATFAENGKTNTLRVNLANTVNLPTSVYLSFGGTATVNTDYIAPSNLITVPAGFTTASMTITGIADALAEGNETIIVNITGGDAPLHTAYPTYITATIIDYPYTKIFLGHPICVPNIIVY